jgi:hypothetical protein
MERFKTINKMKTKVLMAILLAISVTVSNAGPNTPYQKGYQNALIYWHDGVTVTSAYDIESTAEVRAYRQGYQKDNEDRRAFIQGFCDETDKLLHGQ